MRRPDLLLLVACAGCNTVFGVTTTGVIDADVTHSDVAPDAPPDRDRDGVHDFEDPCIASVADGIGDFEGDAYVNGTDGCPFDYENLDSDGDTIYDECDPFVALAGDRRRCIMAFQNPTITRELLVPRANDQAVWNLLNLTGITGMGTGTLVAVEQLEAPFTTSYDLPFHAAPAVGSTAESAVMLWIRTNAAAAAGDVGCQLRGNSSSSQLSLVGSNVPPVAIALAFQGSWKLQATIEPSVTGRVNVRCRVQSWFSTTSVSLRGELSLPPGTAGFGIEEARVVIGGFVVLERDDAPPL